MEINIGIIAIVVLVIAILAILASGYVKASPNKAYIISGIKREPKVLIGRAGRAFRTCRRTGCRT